LRNLDTLRDAVHERVDRCEDAGLLEQVHALLGDGEPELLPLADEDVELVLKELLDD